MLLTENEARTICEKLLSYVKADDATVSVNSENYGHLRFAANAFTTSARAKTRLLASLCGSAARGSASTNEMDDESLKSTVALAEQLARISPVDREYMTLGKQTYQPVNGYAEATSNISVTSRAKTINDAIAACEKSKVIGAGFHQARGGAGASATKNGNFIYDRSSLVSLGMTARTPDGTSSVFPAQPFRRREARHCSHRRRSDSQSARLTQSARAGTRSVSGDTRTAGRCGSRGPARVQFRRAQC